MNKAVRWSSIICFAINIAKTRKYIVCFFEILNTMSLNVKHWLITLEKQNGTFQYI